VTAFEQSDKIGGTWVYSDEIGTDKFGNQIHSSMYQKLHTNLPKELMAFPDFPFPTHEKSFVPANDVNDYLNLYADNFKLRQNVKFEHQALRVTPMMNFNTNKTWEVIVKNLSEEKLETYNFDAVLVCNGHFSTPSFPHYPGRNAFEGRQIHSHDYRRPEMFRGKNVLVIGAGPSGVDISQEIAKCANKVLWSNHLEVQKVLPTTNIIQKPDVAKLTNHGAIFTDGTSENFNDIVYCTGYRYTFPFLSIDCELSCEDNYVKQLYKHCLNINLPSLAVVGLPVNNCPFQTFDLQIRFCLTYMTARKKLPTKKEMLVDTESEMNERWQRGVKTRKAHALGVGYQEMYYNDLAETAGIDPIKPVITKMFNKNRENHKNDFANYRRYKFTVLDDENFHSELLPH
jgi:dimethylaniline monooxygenase (N-oxide forming)